MLSIETLQLLPLSRAQLSMALNDLPELEHDLGMSVLPGVISPPVVRALSMKLSKMDAAPEYMHPWYTYWMICETLPQPLGVGLIGYKGIPDDGGGVEVGYGLDETCWGLGYATLAVRALAGWAFGHADCRYIFASVLKTNPASSRVLQKCGFTAERETDEYIFWRLNHPNTCMRE